MNIGVYFRVSTDKQDLASQELAVKVWLENLPSNKKPENVLVFKDEGISGKTTNRPGYVNLMKAAFSGQIDTIVVYKLDRFSRDASTAIRSILELDQAGVAFISISQQALNLGHDNPFRRTFLAMFADLAEIERETIVSRVNAGLAAAKAKGKKLGNQKIITEETRNKITKLRKQGESIRKIAQQVGLSSSQIHRMVGTVA